MSLNKIIISISKKLKPILSSKEQIALVWIFLITLTVMLFIFFINYLYNLLIKTKLIEGNTSCNVNKKWKEDINVWCTKTNNKIDNLQMFFKNTDTINKTVQKHIEYSNQKVQQLRKKLGYSEDDAKQAIGPAMDTFNKCAHKNCPSDDTTSGTKNDFEWNISKN
jgi:hypothetical protein